MVIGRIEPCIKRLVKNLLLFLFLVLFLMRFASLAYLKKKEKGKKNNVLALSISELSGISWAVCIIQIILCWSFFSSVPVS